MEGNLVIVESPTKAKTIQKFLGKDFIVKSSAGHIRDLKEKSLSIDINSGFTPEYVVPSSKKKLVGELKAAAAKASTVWLASDEDREGEAISWHLVQALGLQGKDTRRIAFHEITKDAILSAIEHPREIDMNLVNAQQARRVLDRLVGFELSPILWRKIQRGLSAGRVQSVTLKLIVDKEREIMAFQPEAYYRVEATFSTGAASVKAVLDTKFKSRDEARKFLEDCIGAAYSIKSVEEKDGTKMPPAPFTTSTLQQEAGKKLRFPSSLTMRVAQSLYERGLITYMRTDSTNLSSLALGTAKSYIIDNFGEEYSHTRQYKTHSKGAQEAHEAIRPTFIANTQIDGTEQEKKLYSLIWKRTVASQMSDAKVLNTTIKIDIDKRPELYTTQSTTIKFDGFMKLYIESADDEQDPEMVILPQVKIGDPLNCLEVKAECKYTQPPFRYSEQSLIKKMEELGIGRPSTYAPTIATLTSGRGYVVVGDKEGTKVSVENLALKNGVISSVSKTETIGAEKRKLLPQEIGIVVSDYLSGSFADIMDYDFTAKIEEDFDNIAEGKIEWNNMISNFYSPFHQRVDHTNQEGFVTHAERELGTDPQTGEKLVAKFGQYGAYVQKGDGDKKQYASLSRGQLIENITLDDALKLFQLPRIVGQYENVDVVALKGPYGPYLKYNGQNVKLDRKADPLTITLDECIKAIEDTKAKTSQITVLAEFKDSGIVLMNGAYGPYIKFGGSNYKIPKGTDPATLDENACKAIVAAGAPTSHKHRSFQKKK